MLTGENVQTIINFGGAIILGFISWFGRELWGQIQKMRSELADFKTIVPQTYVPRTDYRDDIRTLREDSKGLSLKMDRVMELLAEKADR